MKDRLIQPVIKKHIPAAKPEQKKDKGDDAVFIVKSANQWMKESNGKPIPKKLYGTLWLENQWAILFADAKAGKSILAMQIVEAISSGKGNEYFDVEVPAQPVLFLDYELSEKEFEDRYSNHYSSHFKFSDNVYRVEMNRESEDLDQGLDQIFDAIEGLIERYQSKVIVIDNLSYMNLTSTESAKDALPVIKKIIRLKKKFNVSILTLMHTPKRDKSLPLTDANLAGSRAFANYCNSLFALGVAADDHTRYIKQMWNRSAPVQYTADNVLTCETEKAFNFLQLTITGTGREKQYLKEISEKEIKDMDTKILDLMKGDNNLSYRKCVEQLKDDGFITNHMYIKRLCERNSIKR